ncbi:MAG TPA: DUF5658 family protein [Gemmataceae bacterium]|jgi:hypothetical protein|nr:DUF5658 family protein [Gemmataceae bacterium]
MFWESRISVSEASRVLGRSGRFSLGYRFISDKSHIEKLGFCLIALSIFDLILTYFLLCSYSADVYEANPVAEWFLMRWNILGMTFFKFTLVAVVIVSSEIIERHRPRWGNYVLTFACMAVGLVVYQGLQLYSDLTLGAFVSN